MRSPPYAAAKLTFSTRQCSGPSSFASTLLLIALALPAALMLGSTSARALEVGDRAPDFAAPSLDGKGTVSLESYRGKVVYLDFWASWCAPCLKAIPEIEAMRKELASDRFQVVADDADDAGRVDKGRLGLMTFDQLAQGGGQFFLAAEDDVGFLEIGGKGEAVQFRAGRQCAANIPGVNRATDGAMHQMHCIGDGVEHHP